MLPSEHVNWQHPEPKWQHQTTIWQHRWQHRVDWSGNVSLDATGVSNWKVDPSGRAFVQFFHIMVQERNQSQGLRLKVAGVATSLTNAQPLSIA
jgi:hypothetical protein